MKTTLLAANLICLAASFVHMYLKRRQLNNDPVSLSLMMSSIGCNIGAVVLLSSTP